MAKAIIIYQSKEEEVYGKHLRSKETQQKIKLPSLTFRYFTTKKPSYKYWTF